MNTLTDPIPEIQAGADRYTPREVSSRVAGSSQPLDAETLEVVQKFEALYAELSLAAPAAAPARPRQGDAEHALDIDDAFAMLHAAESQGRANAERDALAARKSLKPLRWKNERSPAPARGDTAAAGPAWAGRSRPMWPRLAGAAVIALIVGTGVGYIAATGLKPGAPQAKIPISPQGGAQLQFDYDLGKR